MDGVRQRLEERAEHRPLCEESLVLSASQLQTQRSGGSQVCSCVNLSQYLEINSACKHSSVLNMLWETGRAPPLLTEISSWLLFHVVTWGINRSQTDGDKLVSGSVLPSHRHVAHGHDIWFERFLLLLWGKKRGFAPPLYQQENNSGKHCVIRGSIH